MKKIYETFTNEEFAALKKAKGKMTWRGFIMTLVEVNKVTSVVIKNEGGRE